MACLHSPIFPSTARLNVTSADIENGTISSLDTSLPASHSSITSEKASSSITVEGMTIRDESLGAWTNVLGSWFALFCTFGWLNSLGLFQTYYEQTLLSSYPPSAISWIFTTQLFLMWSGGFLFGPLIDTYGTHPIAIPSALICTSSVAILSTCTQYYQIFLTQGVGFGIAASGLFCCATTSTGQWFHKRKALALGIVLSGSSAGGVVHSLYLHIMISKIGFPAAVRWNALVMGICSAIACTLMHAGLPKKEWSETQNFIDFSLFKQRTFTVYSIGTFFVIWGLFAPWDYLPSMSLRHSFPPNIAVYTIVVLNAGSILGRIIPAHLGDLFGCFTLTFFTSLLTSITLLAFWLPLELTTSTRAQIFAFSACYGFASGAFISLMMPCAAELGPVESTGRRFGTFQVVVGFASLSSLPIQGALIPHAKGGFEHLIKFSGVSIMIGAVFIGVARMLRVRDTQAS